MLAITWNPSKLGTPWKCCEKKLDVRFGAGRSTTSSPNLPPFRPSNLPFLDQDFSLADAVSFVVMRERNVFIPSKQETSGSPFATLKLGNGELLQEAGFSTQLGDCAGMQGLVHDLHDLIGDLFVNI